MVEIKTGTEIVRVWWELRLGLLWGIKTGTAVYRALWELSLGLLWADQGGN